jgi:release factor glutamine methyltransferase
MTKPSPPAALSDPCVDHIPLAPLLQTAMDRLRQAGLESPRLDALYLAEDALTLPLATLRQPRAGASVTAAQANRFLAALDRRLAREPVQRILGGWEFWGLPLRFGPDALIPRPDTETLVDAVRARLPNRQAPLRILDLGTGSGAIALALLSEYPRAFAIGLDLSPTALADARANAVANGLHGRAAFLVGSWAEALAPQLPDHRFDAVVSNPPYIRKADIATLQPEVRLHDPWRALDGGEDGLDAYRIIINQAPALLKEDGLLALEHGADQAESVAALLMAGGFVQTRCVRDLGGRDRVALARLGTSSS